MVIRQYAQAHGLVSWEQKTNAILANMDFTRFYNYDQHLFYFGDIDNPGGGIFADYYSNEYRLVNFVAHALGQLSADEFKLSLAALQMPPGIYDRGTVDTGDDILVEKVAWDGSYFTYTAPTIFIQEMMTDYGLNTIDPATAAQIAYAEDQNYTAWGLSDVFDVQENGYVQQGAPPTGQGGSPETRPGLVAPHVSGMAMITSHKTQALANLRLMTQVPGLYHPDFGFRDSFMANPAATDHNQVSCRFSALGQQWLFLSLVNQQSGVLWDYFYRDADVYQAHYDMFNESVDQVSLYAPSGIVTDTIGNPMFRWTDLPDATSYDLYVGLTDNIWATVFYDTILTSVCDDVFCSVDLTSIDTAAWLPNQPYTAYIQVSGTNNWQGPYPFTIDAPTPSIIQGMTITHISETQPSFSWQLDGASRHSAWFQLYIAPDEDLFNPARTIQLWVSRQEVCTTWVGLDCSWSPPSDLEAGKLYRVYMQSWGAGGFSTGGNVDGVDGWTTDWFNSGGSTPAIPTTSSVAFQGTTLHIILNEDPNTNQYNLAVVLPDSQFILETIQKSDVSCQAGNCELQITLIAGQIQSGTYQVYVQPVGSDGQRGDGILDLGWFEVGDVMLP